jgi:hypothetical protein
LANDWIVILHHVAFSRISVTGSSVFVTSASSRRPCPKRNPEGAREKQAEYRYRLIKDWAATHEFCVGL